MANNDSDDLSLGGAIMGGLAGGAAGVNIALGLTAATGGVAAPVAPGIIGACILRGVGRGAKNPDSPTSPTLSTLGSLGALFGGFRVSTFSSAIPGSMMGMESSWPRVTRRR